MTRITIIIRGSAVQEIEIQEEAARDIVSGTDDNPSDEDIERELRELLSAVESE